MNMGNSEVTYDEVSDTFPTVKLTFGALNRHKRGLDSIRGFVEHKVARRRYEYSEAVTPLDGQQ